MAVLRGAPRFQVQHNDSNFDVVYDTDDGFEMVKYINKSLPPRGTYLSMKDSRKIYNEVINDLLDPVGQICM